MISYKLIAEAITYYSFLGFNFLEAPWIVSKQAVGVTKPVGATEYAFADEGYLVASGEQSFLQLILDSKLTPGRWGCVTPCFRDDHVDRYHKRYFIKVELIDTKDPTQESLEEITQWCLRFYQNLIPGCKVIKTSPNDPLLIPETARDVFSPQDIELGSYGIRQHPDIGRWVYATGCAEPRLSTAYEDYQLAKAQLSVNDSTVDKWLDL